MCRYTSSRRVILLLFFVFLAACHQDPNIRKQRYVESGKRYSTEGRYREAAIQFSNALKIDKNYADAHYALAQTYAQLGHLGAAYGELERTVDLQPANCKARLDLASLLLAGGKVDDAERHTRLVLAAQPNDPAVHAMLSAIAHQRGSHDQALAEIRRAIELDPDRATFHVDLALLQSSDISHASSVESELKRAITLSPKSVNARLLLETFYANAGRWNEAEQAGRDAISADPRSASARQTLARTFLNEGKQSTAEDVLRQASRDLADTASGMRTLADYYLNFGQTANAEVEFATVVAKYPKDISVQEAYACALLEGNDLASARKLIATMAKNSRNPVSDALKAILVLQGGNPNDATDSLMKAVDSLPTDALLQYWLAKAALAKGDVDLAEKSLRNAAILNPSRVVVQQQLARVAAMRGDMNLLADVAGRTIGALPHSPDGYVWRAMVESAHGSYDKADADLKVALSFAPQNAAAYLQFGKLRFAQKRFTEGSTLLEEALRYDSGSVEALRLLVSYDLYQKKPTAALSHITRALERNSHTSGFYDLLAWFHIQNNEFQAASAAAQKAVEVNSNDGEAALLLAQMQLRLGRTDKAVAAWQAWLNDHPNDAGAIAILGTFEELLGNSAKAQTYYTKSLQIQPTNPVAANNLAYLLLESGGDLDVALTKAQVARQGMPNSPNTADTLAWAYYHKGIYGFARDLLEDAARTSPENPTIQLHLGMVYTKLSDRRNASTHLKRAATLAPNSSIARQATNVLQGIS